METRKSQRSEGRDLLGGEGQVDGVVVDGAVGTGHAPPHLHVLFGSKEELQVATVRAAGEALAFELDALGMAANLHAQLCDDGGVHDRVRAAILGRLQAVATSPHPALR